MSSRNRNQGVLDKRENYPTPLPCVEVCCSLLPPLIGSDQGWLEGSAGTGNFAIGLAATYGPRGTVNDPFEWQEFDAVVDRYRLQRLRRKYGQLTRPKGRSPYGLIGGNPPFSVALAHILHSHYLLDDGGYLAFVLPTGLLHPPRTRKSVATRQVPKPFVEIGLEERPGFSKAAGRDSGADSIEYSMFLWRKGYAPRLKWPKYMVSWVPPGRRARGEAPDEAHLRAVYEDLWQSPWPGLIPLEKPTSRSLGSPGARRFEPA